MKIKFSQALDRSRPYPVGADWHPCPCLGFLALRTANCYVNYLYRKGLIGSLPYESEVPTAVLLPCCTDVLGGTRACAVCRRFVKEHVYAGAYYTSDDDGDAESSDSEGSSKEDQDKGISPSSVVLLIDRDDIDGCQDHLERRVASRHSPY